MIIYPAIDLYDGKAVRLFKGDYAQMTVYSDYPPEIAEAFIKAGARRIHTVDLDGAKEGSTPNFDTVLAIKKEAFPPKGDIEVLECLLRQIQKDLIVFPSDGDA